MRAKNAVIVVIAVLVIAGAAAYLVKGGAASGDVQRAPAEKVDLTPTKEHPSNPNFGGGGG